MRSYAVQHIVTSCDCACAYLEVLRADRGHIGDSKNEAYRVEDVGFTGSVQTGDRIEALVPIDICKRVRKQAILVSAHTILR